MTSMVDGHAGCHRREKAAHIPGVGTPRWFLRDLPERPVEGSTRRVAGASTRRVDESLASRT